MKKWIKPKIITVTSDEIAQYIKVAADSIHESVCPFGFFR